jgi:hypothetical protein
MLKTVGNPSTRYGDQTIIGGNLVIGTDGKGIDFSATPGTGTSELLDDYEEGTWTATARCTGNATQTTTVTGYYTKIGRVVTVGFRNMNNIDVSGMAGFFLISLPFACVAGASVGFAGAAALTDFTFPLGASVLYPVTENGANDILFSVTGNTYAGGLLGAAQLTDDATDIKYLTLTYMTA